MVHEERFPATRLSAGYEFRKETLAGTRPMGETRRLQPFPEAAEDQVVFHEPDFQAPVTASGLLAGSYPTTDPLHEPVARSTIRV